MCRGLGSWLRCVIPRRIDYAIDTHIHTYPPTLHTHTHLCNISNTRFISCPCGASGPQAVADARAPVLASHACRCSLRLLLLLLLLSPLLAAAVCVSRLPPLRARVSQVYRNQVGEWDCVATCFFIDTASNIVQVVCVCVCVCVRACVRARARSPNCLFLPPRCKYA
jgi:hypothetical protein